MAVKPTPKSRLGATKQQTPPDVLTVQQTAREWHVNEHVVLAYIHAGDLDAVDVSRVPGVGRPRWRIRRSAIEAFEQARSSVVRQRDKGRGAAHV